MKNRIHYEWDIEETDKESGDIEDHDFRERLVDFVVSSWNRIDGESFVLVLVRNEYEFDGDLKDRTWAYAELENGKWVLPEKFSGGLKEAKVPKKFHKELERRQHVG